MTNLEFRSYNQLRKYPFKDTSSLVSTESLILNDTIITDLLVYRFAPVMYTAQLSSVVVNTGSSTVTLTIVLKELNGSTLTSLVKVIPFSSCVPNELYTSQDSNYGIKLIFGLGITAFITTNKTLTFSSGNADILESNCISPTKLVSSIVLQNNSNSFDTIASGEELELDAGANILLDDGGISVIPEAGTGLFNPCSDDLNILSINFVTPDAKNNFVITADSCYRIDAQENGLYLDNQCKPKCTDIQFKALGNYMLRIKDGTNTISELAKDLANELLASIEEYKTGEALTKNDQYSRHAVSKFPTSSIGQFYYSVVIGFFNPTGEDLLLNCSVSGGTAVANTIRLVTPLGTEVLGSLTLVNKVIPCGTRSSLEFVVKASTLNLTFTGTLGDVVINQTITKS